MSNQIDLLAERVKAHAVLRERLADRAEAHEQSRASRSHSTFFSRLIQRWRNLWRE